MNIDNRWVGRVRRLTAFLLGPDGDSASTAPTQRPGTVCFGSLDLADRLALSNVIGGERPVRSPGQGRPDGDRTDPAG
jgi:hypothetical protein